MLISVYSTLCAINQRNTEGPVESPKYAQFYILPEGEVVILKHLNL